VPGGDYIPLVRRGRKAKNVKTGMTAQEFKELRRLTDLTQEQAAVMVLGVTARTVARWESGESRISELESSEIRRRMLAAAASKGTVKAIQ
jgi:DNA-binding transcriptional regulator YiaG